MQQTEIGFLAILTRRVELPAAAEPRYENAKAAFWEPIRRALDRRYDESVTNDSLEGRIERELPRALHAQLTRHFSLLYAETLGLNLRRADELSAVFFRVKVAGYGSADLEVTIGGVETLARLLNDHLDTFTMLMEAFVPAAFIDVLPQPHSVRGEQFKAHIEPTLALRSAFTHLAPSPTTKDSPLPKSQKIIHALNTTVVSLLTPVLLALAVLWTAGQMVINDRAHLEAREKQIGDEELALHQADAQQLATLQAQNLELTRLLRVPPAPAVPAPPGPALPAGAASPRPTEH